MNANQVLVRKHLTLPLSKEFLQSTNRFRITSSQSWDLSIESRQPSGATENCLGQAHGGTRIYLTLLASTLNLQQIKTRYFLLPQLEAISTRDCKWIFSQPADNVAIFKDCKLSIIFLESLASSEVMTVPVLHINYDMSGQGSRDIYQPPPPPAPQNKSGSQQQESKPAQQKTSGNQQQPAQQNTSGNHQQNRGSTSPIDYICFSIIFARSNVLPYLADYGDDDSKCCVIM